MLFKLLFVVSRPQQIQSRLKTRGAFFSVLSQLNCRRTFEQNGSGKKMYLGCHRFKLHKDLKQISYSKFNEGNANMERVRVGKCVKEIEEEVGSSGTLSIQHTSLYCSLYAMNGSPMTTLKLLSKH